MRTLLLACALMLSSVVGPVPAQARPLLTIGHSSEPSSMDPLFSRTGNNQAAAENIFERLVSTDENMQIRPGLALSWRALEPTLWEIRLRPGVLFHDGTPFTADDVVFSMDRAAKVPNSPAPFTGAVRAIAGIDVVDPLTLRIHTRQPTPDLMEQVGLVYILSRHAAQGKRSEDYNSGEAAIGTGPYKFKRWQPGDSLELERNDRYWGRRPDFDRVVIRYIANDAARVSALLSGSVDMIDSVPPNDARGLEHKPGYTLFRSASARLIYLALDSSRDASPYVTDADGKPTTVNPLKDVRVRRAISMMFMREPITTRLLNGAGVPAGQMVPEGLGGYDPDLPPPAYDLQGARALLAQAGYPKGFGLTIHSSNDRFAGDSDLAQALAQMMARAGLRINGVVTQPYNVYAGASSKQQYSAFIFSYGNSTSDSSNGLTNVLATYDKAAGTGAFNRARYSNPELDRLLAKAAVEFDTGKRDALLRQAAEAGFNDVGIVPLYFPVVFWAARDGIVVRANKLERTSMLYIEEAK
ncbi:ABC transporter substrate-binding protein [Achromobacter aloeverae]|uniref:ABC transporter substrate-binding protein n=1 Tax=Achromobacter aloeverae TaxID=1750518 RepID=A0A4Q1HGI3_9BURK|nr:ABC transporter substrate-binding protein [Achromobacter aloeverae]RXN85294.1 ABC transporter substrate-binding protein [Achromobacter aloeverae]